MNATEYKNLKELIAEEVSTYNVELIRGELSQKLLTSKTTKYKKSKGATQYGLPLLPADLYPGMDVCFFSKNCKHTCLALSGRNMTCQSKNLKGGLFTKHASHLRLMCKRSFLLKEDPAYFHKMLLGEILRILSKDSNVWFRLNHTSDLDWVSFIFETTKAATRLGLSIPRFYDYTKNPRRIDKVKRCTGVKYYLTFSHSERQHDRSIKAMLKKCNVAKIYSDGLPKEDYGVPVIDGDRDDERYKDPFPCIVGLKKKVTI